MVVPMGRRRHEAPSAWFAMSGGKCKWGHLKSEDVSIYLNRAARTQCVIHMKDVRKNQTDERKTEFFDFGFRSY